MGQLRLRRGLLGAAKKMGPDSSPLHHFFFFSLEGRVKKKISLHERRRRGKNDAAKRECELNANGHGEERERERTGLVLLYKIPRARENSAAIISAYAATSTSSHIRTFQSMVSLVGGVVELFAIQICQIAHDGNLSSARSFVAPACPNTKRLRSM